MWSKKKTMTIENENFAKPLLAVQAWFTRVSHRKQLHSAMKTQNDIRKLIERVEKRILKYKNRLYCMDKFPDNYNNKNIKQFWKGALCEAEFLHLHLTKLFNKHQKRIK